MNNAAYTSSAKDWWQKNSDRLGGEMNWDAFCEVWMAALNTVESAPPAPTNSVMDTMPALAKEWAKTHPVAPAFRPVLYRFARWVQSRHQ